MHLSKINSNIISSCCVDGKASETETFRWWDPLQICCSYASHVCIMENLILVSPDFSFICGNKSELSESDTELLWWKHTDQNIPVNPIHPDCCTQVLSTRMRIFSPSLKQFCPHDNRFYKISSSTRELKNDSKRANKHAGPAGGDKVSFNDTSNPSKEHSEHA